MTDPTKALADVVREFLNDGLPLGYQELIDALAAYAAAQATDTHADTREGWEWREEVFRLRKEKEALLQAAKAVVFADNFGACLAALGPLRDEVERASEGGAA